ncbi:unnamed protein product [Cunninghamella blakesleeana]
MKLFVNLILLATLLLIGLTNADSTCSKNVWITICVNGRDQHTAWGIFKLTSGKSYRDVLDDELIVLFNRRMDGTCSMNRGAGTWSCSTNSAWRSADWSDRGNLEFDCNSGNVMGYGFGWRSRDYYCRGW